MTIEKPQFEDTDAANLTPQECDCRRRLLIRYAQNCMIQRLQLGIESEIAMARADYYRELVGEYFQAQDEEKLARVRAH